MIVAIGIEPKIANRLKCEMASGVVEIAYYNLKKVPHWFADKRNATQRWRHEMQMPVTKK